jgi:hypothetical protein
MRMTAKLRLYHLFLLPCLLQNSHLWIHPLTNHLPLSFLLMNLLNFLLLLQPLSVVPFVSHALLVNGGRSSMQLDPMLRNQSFGQTMRKRQTWSQLLNLAPTSLPWMVNIQTVGEKPLHRSTTL